MKNLLTPNQQARKDRNDAIRKDFNMLNLIHGNTTGGVILSLRNKYGKKGKPMSDSRIRAIIFEYKY